MKPAMEEGFKINKAYADKYNIWRQKEELQKLKDRYGDEDDSDDSSTSESEDEDAEALTEQLDKDWLRTLAALKSKDPKIYQKDVKFYHDDDNEETTKATGSKKSKDKPMYLKDYERKVLLEKGGIFNEEEELSQQEEPSTSVKSSLSYHQEQEELRKSIVAAAGDDSSSEDSDDNDTGLLKKRDKSAEEKTKEDFEYLEWLKGQKPSLEKDKEVGKDLAPLKNYWEKKDLDEGERFLKNYILNRQYIDNDDDESVPMYDDIVNDDEDDENFSDEEELLVKQDSFERKYNFRFEEPDAAETKTFPRNFEESVRRKDTKRAEKRKETKERKKKEKEKKKEELKQLKKLKRQEILDKIEKLKEITGNKKLGFDENDLDEDFDPQKHDAMMETCFDDDYYDTGETEEIKPVFEMSDEEGDWDNWKGGDNEAGTSAGGSDDPYANDEYYDDWNQQPDGEDPNFIMDADYDPEADRLRKKTKKEKKKKNKLAQALQTKKPVFDPNEKTFEEYFDEYYKLDYEDIIDDMPCRFKYRKVVPNNFGLTVDEIMKSRDKELNAWVSVKKMSQYRTEDEEMQDVRVFQNKGKNERKKKHILTSLYSGDRDKDEEPDIVSNLPHQQTDADDKSGKKKRKRRKGKKKQPSTDDAGGGQTDNIPNSKMSASGSNKVKATVNGEITNNRELDSPDKNTESDEGGVKHGKKRKAEDSVEDLSVDSTTLDGEKKSNKKKKKKHRSDDSAEMKVDSEIVGESEKVSSKKSENVVNSVNEDGESKNEDRKKKNKKKKKNKNKGDRKLEMSEDRLKAYGINPKKYKYMKKEELFQIKPRKNKQVS